MNCMRLSMSLIKRKRNPEEGNIGNYIADEGFYEDRDKIMQVIRGYFWDRFFNHLLAGRGGAEEGEF
jgi:hypothetical protein